MTTQTLEFLTDAELQAASGGFGAAAIDLQRILGAVLAARRGR